MAERTEFDEMQQFGVLYYLPMYYQIVLGYTPLMSGVGLVSVVGMRRGSC